MSLAQCFGLVMMSPIAGFHRQQAVATAIRLQHAHQRHQHNEKCVHDQNLIETSSSIDRFGPSCPPTDHPSKVLHVCTALTGLSAGHPVRKSAAATQLSACSRTDR